MKFKELIKELDETVLELTYQLYKIEEDEEVFNILYQLEEINKRIQRECCDSFDIDEIVYGIANGTPREQSKKEELFEAINKYFKKEIENV